MADSIFNSVAFWIFIIGLIVLIVGVILFTTTVSNTWKWGVTITGIVIIFIAIIIYLVEYSQKPVVATVPITHVYTEQPTHVYQAPPSVSPTHVIQGAPTHVIQTAQPAQVAQAVYSPPPSVAPTQAGQIITSTTQTGPSGGYMDKVKNWYNTGANAVQGAYSAGQRVGSDAYAAYNRVSSDFGGTTGSNVGEITANV